MANVFDVAKYVLEHTGEISTWKLQKLCYYSQAWQLAWTSKPIFGEDFRAYANGPVCNELFHSHKGMFYISAKDIAGNVSALSDDEKETIDIILKDYGGMEPYELRELSHREKPWIDARGDIPNGERCDTIITKESMGEYYGGL